MSKENKNKIEDNNIEKENIKEENVEKKKVPLGEKVEDTLDNVVGGVQDAIYGEKNSENIISTIEKPNGIRVVNKVQTRRNINNKLFGNKKFLKGLLIAFGVVLGIFVVYNIVFALLMK